jgi:hypothetical protein
MSGVGSNGVEPERQRKRDAIPEVVRFAASAWWHTTEWTFNQYAKVAKGLIGAAPSSPEEAADRMRAAANEVTGTREEEKPTLAETGEMLLVRSRDVFETTEKDDAHPAYERILSEMAPDEGRILRLLLVDGPRPAVDVRTGGPLGLLNSELIAGGFTLIGSHAGLKDRDGVPAYLNNLNRLGLIWFSRETLHDHRAYQVLEAQPNVLEAMHSVRFAKVVRRSIHLTPFGEDLCRVCFTGPDTPIEELPIHSDPPED